MPVADVHWPVYDGGCVCSQLWPQYIIYSLFNFFSLMCPPLPDTAAQPYPETIKLGDLTIFCIRRLIFQTWSASSCSACFLLLPEIALYVIVPITISLSIYWFARLINTLSILSCLPGGKGICTSFSLIASFNKFLFLMH